MDQRKRGSDTLIAAYRAGGFKIDDQLIEKLADAVGETDVHDVLVKGLPAVDYLRTTFAPGTAQSAGSLVAGLLEAVGTLTVPVTVRVFPRGIPWPGEYIVDLTIAQEQA